MISVATFNLGCASPSAVGAQRRTAALEWGRALRSSGDHDLLFLQEVPGEQLLDEFRAGGWEVACGDGPTYRVRSAVVWKSDRLTGRQIAVPTATYHGSYLAAAELATASGTTFTAVSFHASPAEVQDDYVATWQSLGLPVPPARRGGGRSSGRLWDADMVLASLKLLAEQGPVLAAGDLNESLKWDTVHGESWAQLLHERAAEEPGALRFALHDLWAGEKRTLFMAGAPDYQLDHVLATPDLSGAIVDAWVDGSWSESQVATGSQSDHAPVYFNLDAG